MNELTNTSWDKTTATTKRKKKRNIAGKINSKQKTKTKQRKYAKPTQNEREYEEGYMLILMKVGGMGGKKERNMMNWWYKFLMYLLGSTRFLYVVKFEGCAQKSHLKGIQPWLNRTELKESEREHVFVFVFSSFCFTETEDPPSPCQKKNEKKSKEELESVANTHMPESTTAAKKKKMNATWQNKF